MWQAKQMYEERDSRGQRIWSMRMIAAKLGISETSVLRAVTNTGRFANLNAKPLPEAQSRTEEQWRSEAEASVKRLQEMMAAERAERSPETNRADRMLSELKTPLAPQVKDRYLEYLGAKPVQSEEKKDEPVGPVSPLDE